MLPTYSIDYMNSLSDHRFDYATGQLNRADLAPEPLDFFQQWLDQVKAVKLDYNAMSVATVDKQGQPSSRVVLLRDIQPKGLVFYTDNRSNKAQDIEATGSVAALFYWHEFERQVRIQGQIEALDFAVGDRYFQTRPRESQLSASASFQSSVIDNRQTLEQAVDHLSAQYPKTVPTPKHWQGYLIKPHYWEFWQGRIGRLHDRFCYQKQQDQWCIERLSP